MISQWKFLRAFWNDWRAVVMGGSLSMGVVIYGWSTGGQLVGLAGWIMLALTFLHGAAKAWDEEHERAESLSLQVAAFASGIPRVEVTEYESMGSPFAVHVELVNPGTVPVAFERDWLIDVKLADGQEYLDGVGYLEGEIRALQQGERFRCAINFMRPFVNQQAYLRQDALSSATFWLRVKDIYGRSVEATWRHP